MSGVAKAIIVLVIAVLTGLRPLPARACELDLVLAVDVSGSVNVDEYKLQMKGLADAFRSTDIIHLIGQTARRGAVNVTVVQWSGAPHQAQIVGWTALTDEASVLAFADRITAAKRAFVNYSTAIGEMLAYTAGLIAARPAHCRRRVIDISGDGPNNEGGEIAPPRRQLLGENVTINALAIVGEEEGLAGYFRDRVIGGNGAFLVTAENFRDFPDAIRRKLLREIAPPITYVPHESRRQATLTSCRSRLAKC